MTGQRLYWIDLETTGLNPQRNHILEIAVYEATLEEPFTAREIYCSLVWAPWTPQSRRADPVVVEMHTRSGLIAEMANDIELDGPETVECALLALVPPTEPDDPKHILAGSSVHFDMGFLRAHMPTLAARFSHRMFDVSAMELLARNLGMPKPDASSENPHRARADVIYSIEKGRQIRDWLAGRRSALGPTRVFIASPFAGIGETDEERQCDADENLAYAIRCQSDAIARGESPYVPHLSLPHSLDDSDPQAREKVLALGRAQMAGQERVAVYVDRGIRSGMSGEIEHAERLGIPVDRRRIGT